MNFHFVRADRYDTLETLLLLEEGRFYINEPSFEQRLHLRLDFVQFLLRFGVKRNIQPDVEYLFVCLLKIVQQLLKVSVSGIKHRVPDEAFFFPSLDLALDFRHFFLKLPQDFRRLHGVNEDCDVEYLVQIDYGRNPSLGKEARERNDKK